SPPQHVFKPERNSFSLFTRLFLLSPLENFSLPPASLFYLRLFMYISLVFGPLAFACAARKLSRFQPPKPRSTYLSKDMHLIRDEQHPAYIAVTNSRYKIGGKKAFIPECIIFLLPPKGCK